MEVHIGGTEKGVYSRLLFQPAARAQASRRWIDQEDWGKHEMYWTREARGQGVTDRLRNTVINDVPSGPLSAPCYSSTADVYFQSEIHGRGTETKAVLPFVPSMFFTTISCSSAACSADAHAGLSQPILRYACSATTLPFPYIREKARTYT